MNTPTSIEIIKAYYNMENALSQEQQKKIADLLNLQQVDLDKRLWGKNNEIEFIFMLYLLNSC